MRNGYGIDPDKIISPGSITWISPLFCRGGKYYRDLPGIEKLMLRTRYLRHSWQKFRETLIEPSADEDRGPKVVLNTARPQNYFNTAEAGLRFPLYRAIRHCRN